MMLRWSTQRANERYKDHLDGQKTSMAQALWLQIWITDRFAHQKRTVTDYTNIEALCAMGSFQKLFRAEEVGRNTEMLFRASGDWCSDLGWLLPTNGHHPVFVEMTTGGVGHNKWIMVAASFVVVVFVVVAVVFGQKPARIGKDGKPLLNRSQVRFQDFSWNILWNFFDGTWDYNNIPR